MDASTLLRIIGAMRTNHIFAALVACTITLANAQSSGAAAPKVPTFKVDPSWPLEMPNNWIMSVVTGVFVDAKQHVWVTNLPEQLTEEETFARAEAAHGHLLRCTAARARIR